MRNQEYYDSFINKKVGSLEIVEYLGIKCVGKSKVPQSVVKCKCDCGIEKEIALCQLTKKIPTLTCGGKIHGRKSKAPDIIGRNFNKLLVVELYSIKNGVKQYTCTCDCGNTKIVSRQTLKCPKNKGCGCGKRNLSMKLPFGEAHWRYIEKSYSNGAKLRCLEWGLSRENVREICSKNCFYCDIEPQKIYGAKANKSVNGLIKANGIDRVHNNVGYLLDNCVPCCELCNKAKKNLDYNEWTAWLKRISTKWNNSI